MIPNDIKCVIDFTIGDGYIGFKSAGRKSATMRIEHSIKQKDYAMHKADILEQFGFKTTRTEYTSKSGKNIGKQYYRVDVWSDPRLIAAHHHVYNGCRKAIDKHLLNCLDARSLAYWFMDDGSARLVKYNQKDTVRYVYDIPKIGGFKFSNQCFSIDENKLFVDWLAGFNITAYITTRNGIEVYISTIESKERFRDLIQPYIVPTMLYKISNPLSFVGITHRIVQRERLNEKGAEMRMR